MAEYTDVFPYKSSVIENEVVNSTTFTELISLTETMPAGVYLLSLSMTYNSPSTVNSFYYRTTRDLAGGPEIAKESKDSTDVYAITVMRQYTHAGGVLDIGVEFRKENTQTSDITILEAGIFALRVA